MSFDDYLSRPRFEIEGMLKVIDSIDKKKNTINENLLNNLKNSTPKSSDID